MGRLVGFNDSFYATSHSSQSDRSSPAPCPTQRQNGERRSRPNLRQLRRRWHAGGEQASYRARSLRLVPVDGEQPQTEEQPEGVGVVVEG
jgi:hypothetical protein